MLRTKLKISFIRNLIWSNIFLIKNDFIEFLVSKLVSMTMINQTYSSKKDIVENNILNDFKESYWGLDILERRVKLNNKTPFHRQILTVFANNIELTVRRDLVRLKHFFCFSKIEDSIIP